MNVGYLINVYPAPSHSFIRREIAALRELGINVRVFSIRQFRGRLVSEGDRKAAATTGVILDGNWIWAIWSSILTVLTAPLRSVRTILLAARMGWRWLAYFSEACVLSRWLRDEQIDHLHVHFGTNSAAVAMLCRQLGGPKWSLTIHGPEEFENGDQISLREKIAAASFVVGISDFGIQQLKGWCDPAEWSKLKLVRCGLDDAFLSAPLTDVPDVNKIVCVGRLCERKMQHVLIEAIAKLPVQLTLVGDGPERARLEKQVHEVGLRARVHFAGWADEHQVLREILSSRVMVLPSRAEGLPVVIMEAFALGRPVISTHVAGIPELVSHGKSGWLVEPNNVEQLANAIDEAMKTPVTTLTEMACVGRKRVLQLHDARANANLLAKLFQSAF